MGVLDLNLQKYEGFFFPCWFTGMQNSSQELVIWCLVGCLLFCLFHFFIQIAEILSWTFSNRIA